MNTKTVLRSYAAIIISACCMAVNYEILILSNQFAPAGINGIATMVQYLFHFSVGYMSILINVPLAILCFFLVDRRFALRTLVFSLTFSGILLLLQNGIIDISRFIYHTDDGRSTIIAPIASGVINGAIYAVLLRNGASTGGTDFVAAYIRKSRPEYSMMKVIFVLNAIVALASYFVYDFNIEPVILCIAYCFTTSFMSDRIQKGGKEALKVELITQHPDEITELVIKELHHSATILHAEGAFSHTGKTMMIVVVNKHQITAFMELLSRFPETFAIVSNVNETVGNFKKIGRTHHAA